MIDRRRFLALGTVLFTAGAACSSSSSVAGAASGGGPNATGSNGGSGGAATSSGTAGRETSTGAAGSAGAGMGGSGGADDAGFGGAAGNQDAGGIDAPSGAFPDFGPNVLVFDPSMPMNTIQSRIDAIVMQQQTSQFGSARYAYFFKPGQYNLDVRLGYYMQVLGLGASPDDVTIRGAVRSKADYRTSGNALVNFLRGAENLAGVPTQ